jgi:hypothetical protein
MTAHSKCECARAFGGFDEGEGDSLGEGLLPVNFALPAGDVETGDGKISHVKAPLRKINVYTGENIARMFGRGNIVGVYDKIKK